MLDSSVVNTCTANDVLTRSVTAWAADGESCYCPTARAASTAAMHTLLVLPTRRSFMSHIERVTICHILSMLCCMLSTMTWLAKYN
jgi:hypothetical protein